MGQNEEGEENTQQKKMTSQGPEITLEVAVSFRRKVAEEKPVKEPAGQNQKTEQQIGFKAKEGVQHLDLKKGSRLKGGRH